MKTVKLRGLGVSEGRGGGAIRKFAHETARPDRAAGSAEEEIRRLHIAIEAAREELRSIRRRDESEALIEAHLLLLEDPILIAEVEKRLAAGKRHRTAEEVLEEVMETFAALFETKKEPLFRERAADLRDVGGRVLTSLTGAKAEPPADGVIVARDLPPTLLLEIKDPRKIAGILLESGGPTSHTVILARGLGIPTVIGIEGLLEEAREGWEAEIDGATGEVELLPPGHHAARAPKRKEVAHTGPRETRTSDGVRITVRANIQLPVEVEYARETGAEGIGLYRTEYLMLEHRDFPEKEITEEIHDALAAFPDETVTVRTADIGGDKFGGDPHLDLGLRAIRLSLSQPDQFKRELGAYLAAARRRGAKGNLRLLLPMVSTVAEIDRVRKILSGLTDKKIPLGIMVETPGAALTIDLFAGKIDFASIGTNDLAQYTMAAERGNSRLADLLDPCQPAFLRLLFEAVRRAAAAEIPLAVCGEMAGDPARIAILLGLGIREISVSPRRIPEIRRAISEISIEKAESQARSALRDTSSAN